MKIKLGETDYLMLDRSQLEKRFSECAGYSTLLAEVRCGLDQAAQALSTGSGKATAVKGLAQAGKAAAEIKRKVWVPDDRTAYAVEKSAGDLSKRLAKGKANDPAASKKALASVRAIEAKAKAMEAARKGNVCGIQSYEGVKIERKY